jgi:hypothetical protein
VSTVATSCDWRPGGRSAVLRRPVHIKAIAAPTASRRDSGYIAGSRRDLRDCGAYFLCADLIGEAVAFPYPDVFIGLLGAYMVYSAWARLDSRYLIAAALVLLVVAAIVDAGGATGAANTLAVYVFFLLAGGVVLLLVDHVREERQAPTADRPPSEGGGGGPQDPTPQSTEQR